MFFYKLFQLQQQYILKCGVHNTYYTILASLGTLGLLLYLGIWFQLFYKTIRYKTEIKKLDINVLYLVSILLIICKIIQGLATNGSDGSAFVCMMFFAGICVNICNRIDEEKLFKTEKSNDIKLRHT